MKAKEAVFSRRDAETQREVLDRINRIDRIDGSGDSNALQSNLDTPTHENPVVPRVGEPIFFCRERQFSCGLPVMGSPQEIPPHQVLH